MPKPPLASGRQVVSAFKRAGYVVVGQKGSHIKMFHPAKRITVIIPNHSEVDRWTLMGILHAADIQAEEFRRLLR